MTTNEDSHFCFNCDKRWYYKAVCGRWCEGRAENCPPCSGLPSVLALWAYCSDQLPKKADSIDGYFE